MGKLRPFVQKESYMPNKKWIPFVIGNGYTTVDGASGPAPEWDTAIGNPVSFNALTPWPLRQLKVAFSPAQDLHGYDAPWPAGGGANKWDEELEVGGIDDSTGEPSISPAQRRSKNFIPVSPETSYYACCPNVGGGGFWVYCYDENKAFIGRVVKSGSYDVRNSVFQTLAGSAYIKFKTQSTTANYADISINYPSSVTTYSPYSNECPISGWDSLNVEQASEILAELTSSASASGVTCTTNTDGSVTVKGTCTDAASLDFYRNSATFPGGISAGDRCVISIGEPIDEFQVYSYKAAALTSLVSFSNTDHAEFTIPQDATGMLVRILSKAGVTYDTTLHVRICPYDDYRSISISLGQTVYSGYVDVISGVGEIDKAAIDMGTLSWTYVSAFDCFTALVGRDDYRAKDAFSAKCSSYPFVGAYTNLTDKSCAYIYNVHVAVKDTAYGTDANAFGTAMNGVQLVYELAEPLTIQLTPQEVESLAGDNVLFSDANGDLTVTYRSN